MNDLISRELAIDAFTVYSEYESNRTNVEWVARIHRILLSLPSAQPEIIRCKDCKHGMYDVMCKFYWCHGVPHSPNWYCANAERNVGCN